MYEIIEEEERHDNFAATKTKNQKKKKEQGTRIPRVQFPSYTKIPSTIFNECFFFISHFALNFPSYSYKLQVAIRQFQIQHVTKCRQTE